MQKMDEMTAGLRGSFCWNKFTHGFYLTRKKQRNMSSVCSLSEGRVTLKVTKIKSFHF